MRVAFAVILLSAGMAQGQERVFHFAHTQTTAGFQQVANPVRALTGAAQVSVDAAEATLTVQGSADQLAMAEWLFNALDTTPRAGSTDYPLPGSQEVLRVFYLANAETAQSLQELLNLVRAHTEIQWAFPCAGPTALVFRGSTGQLGVAGYLIEALDKPAGQPNQHSATPAFPVPLGSDQVARVFYLAYTRTPQQMQELVNLTRSVSDMQRVFPYTALNAVALRGTSDEMALAAWLFDALDKPASQTNRHMASAEYLVPPGRGNLSPVVRVFYLAHCDTPQSLQEMVNVIRAMGDVQRVFPNNAMRAVAVRGTASQMALAAWLFDTLDQPGQNPGATEFRGAGDDVTRVFVLSHTGTPQALQEIVSAVRSAANVQRVLSYWPPKAVAVRGTGEQVTVAARVIGERDK